MQIIIQDLLQGHKFYINDFVNFIHTHLYTHTLIFRLHLISYIMKKYRDKLIHYEWEAFVFE